MQLFALLLSAAAVFGGVPAQSQAITSPAPSPSTTKCPDSSSTARSSTPVAESLTPPIAVPLSAPITSSLFLNKGSSSLDISNVPRTTPFASLLSSIAASLMLTLFTEFGDRTFFIAAILALRHPKWLVFIGTCAALIVQTVFSSFVGHLLHQLPNSKLLSSLSALPLDDYAASILLFTFGFIHLKAAFEDTSDAQREGGAGVEIDTLRSELLPTTTSPDPIATTDSRIVRTHDNSCYYPIGSDTNKRLSLGTLHRRSSLGQAELLEAERVVSDHPLVDDESPWPILRKVFWMIFVAELGDKSMLSTVALAAAQNPYGVFVGSSAAHCLVTLVAVVAGSCLEGVISEKIANMICAALFFIFGTLSLIEGLARQGIGLWWWLVNHSEGKAIATLAYITATSSHKPLKHIMS